MTETPQVAPAWGRFVAGGALLLAVVAGGLGFVPALLPASAIVLLLALGLVVAYAYVVGSRRAKLDPQGELGGDAPFATQVTFHLALALLYTVVLILLLVELLTLPAVAGKLEVFGDFALSSVRLYPVITGLIIAAIAAVIHLGASARPSRSLSRGKSQHEGYLWLGLTLVFSLATVATALGVLAGAGLRAERAVFMLAGGIVPAFFFARAWARLPSLGEINDWFEREERIRESGLLRGLTYGFAGLTIAGTLVASLSAVGLVPRTPGLLALAAAIVFLIPAAFSVGVTRILAQLEGSGESITEARKKRRVILNALSISLAILGVALGLATFLAFLAQVAGVGVFQSLLEAFVAFYPAILSAALWVLVGTVLVRTRVGTEIAYTDALKTQTILGAAFALVLLFFGVFIGAGFAQGTGVEIENAVLALSGAVLSLTAFVKARTLLPSVFGIIKEAVKTSETADVELQEDIKKKMMFTYLGGLVFLLGLIGFFVARALGVVKPADSVATETGYFVYLLIGLVLGVLIVVRLLQQRSMDPRWRKKQQEDIGKKRLSAEELTRYLTLGICGAIALVLVLIGVLIKTRVLSQVGSVEIHEKFSTDFFVFAIMLGIGPWGYFYNREQKRIAAINAKFPEFLRDLAESQRAGMTLTEAVITASKGDYGALTPEIRKMAAQIEWGVSFSDALRRFSKRVRTPLIERSTSLIIQAANAGGNVVDILTAAADDARDIQMILKERKSSMSIYVMIIYVAFAVFVGVITVLNSQFIPEVSKAVAKADGVSIGGLKFQKFDEQVFKALFFHAAVIQGLGGGLVAGVMEGGKPVQGLKHAFIMIAISYVVFRFFIGG